MAYPKAQRQETPYRFEKRQIALTFKDQDMGPQYLLSTDPMPNTGLEPGKILQTRHTHSLCSHRICSLWGRQIRSS